MHIQEILNAIYANHHYEYFVVNKALKVIEYSDRVFELCETENIDCDSMMLYDAVSELHGLEEEITRIFRGEKEEFTLSYVFKAPDQYVHINLSPGRKLKHPDEDSYRYETMIVLFENITELANIQQKIIQERNEKSLLLKTISEKNEQLQIFNEQMQQLVDEEIRKNLEKQKMVELQARYSQMGEMIGMITHQWKQPLNVISIVNYVLQQKIHKKAYCEELFLTKLEEISKQVRFMDQTIRDFHDFFNPTLEKSVFNIYETLTFAIELVKYEYQFHNIELILKGDREIVACGYPNEFNQVILSLLKNAKDAFLENPGAQMRIELEIDGYEGRPRVRIRDNAGGIPQEIVGHIFDLYVTTKEDGSGLGLNIAKNVIENNMDGELSVRNVDGGAEFTILLQINCP
jgi:signal transduction histidine kinase